MLLLCLWIWLHVSLLVLSHIHCGMSDTCRKCGNFSYSLVDSWKQMFQILSGNWEFHIFTLWCFWVMTSCSVTWVPTFWKGTFSTLLCFEDEGSMVLWNVGNTYQAVLSNVHFSLSMPWSHIGTVTSALDGFEWSTSCHGHFYSRKEPWYALTRRLVMPWIWSGCFAEEENLFPQPKFKSQIVLACNLVCVPTVIPWCLVIVNLDCW